MSKRISPAKSWCFTLNNFSENEYGSLVHLFSEISEKNSEFYYIVAKEIGEEGTPHLQGYITSGRKFRPLPKFSVKRDGVECIRFFKAKGNSVQNYRYCAKDGNYVTNMPKPYMNVEEAQVIWDEPCLLHPDGPEFMGKEEWRLYIDQIDRKEAAAQVLTKAHFDQEYELRQRNS